MKDVFFFNDTEIKILWHLFNVSNVDVTEGINSYEPWNGIVIFITLWDCLKNQTSYLRDEPTKHLDADSVALLANKNKNSATCGSSAKSWIFAIYDPLRRIRKISNRRKTS